MFSSFLGKERKKRGKFEWEEREGGGVRRSLLVDG